MPHTSGLLLSHLSGHNYLTIKPEMSVCLFTIFSSVYRPIGTKLGRAVGDRYRIRLGTLVSMVTNLLPWQLKICDFGLCTTSMVQSYVVIFGGRAPVVRSCATLSVWVGESQCGNPIGSELVKEIRPTLVTLVRSRSSKP